MSSKSKIVLIVCCAVVVGIFAAIVLWPKNDNKGTKETAEESPIDKVFVNPVTGYLTDEEVIESIRKELGVYSDLNLSDIAFSTDDSDNLYAVVNYDIRTTIGIKYCISTGETVCDIVVSASDLMPAPRVEE